MPFMSFSIFKAALLFFFFLSPPAGESKRGLLVVFLIPVHRGGRRREDSDGALIMQLPGDREERLVCSEILLHPFVFPRKKQAHPFPSLLHSPCKPSPPHQKFKQSEMEWNHGVHSHGNQKHRKSWITGTEPGLQLIHALTPSFLLSFWSFPRFSTSPRGQNLTHTPVLPCAVQVSSTSASSASTWERPALGLGSTKPKISTLDTVSCILWPQTPLSLWQLNQCGLSPPYSLRVSTRDAQTAPKLTWG